MTFKTRLKREFDSYRKEGGPLRTLIFAISGIVTLVALAGFLIVGVKIGSSPEYVVGILGLSVAILALIPTYFDNPSKDELVRLWKENWFAALAKMSNAIVMLTLAFLSFVLAILNFI